MKYAIFYNTMIMTRMWSVLYINEYTFRSAFNFRLKCQSYSIYSGIIKGTQSNDHYFANFKVFFHIHNYFWYKKSINLLTRFNVAMHDDLTTTFEHIFKLVFTSYIFCFIVFVILHISLRSITWILFLFFLYLWFSFIHDICIWFILFTKEKK